MSVQLVQKYADAKFTIPQASALCMLSKMNNKEGTYQRNHEWSFGQKKKVDDNNPKHTAKKLKQGLYAMASLVTCISLTIFGEF